MASTIAEKLTQLDANLQTVVGWYHSHPHITAMPSHVDVRTQGHYQQLDIGFIGLIFSVFDKGRLEICAFQSRGSTPNSGDCQWATVQVPVVILYDPPPTPCSKFSVAPIPISSENIVALLAILLNEDKQIFQAITTPNSSVDELQRHGDGNSNLNNLTRYFNVYQSSLLHLIDLQLLPTLSALQSRSQTLKQERDRLLLKLKQQGSPPLPSHPSSPSTTSNLSERIAIFELLTPAWSLSAVCLQLAFHGTIITLSRLPPSWEKLSTTRPHHLRIIPTAHDMRHLCPPYLSIWSIQLDQDPLYTLPILSMSPHDRASQIDCLWMVGDLPAAAGSPPSTALFGFNLVGRQESGDLRHDEREHFVELFRTVLEKSLYIKH